MMRWAFEIVAISAGRLGSLSLAAQSVIMTTDQVLNTIPFGIGKRNLHIFLLLFIPSQASLHRSELGTSSVLKVPQALERQLMHLPF